MNFEETVRALADRAAIQDLLQRYAHGVDRRDIDLVASCFAPDATYKGALGEGPIGAALEALRERMMRYESTMHFIGNQLVDIQGDRARSETYAIAYHQLVEEGSYRQMVVGVRYIDRLERREGRWLICDRVVVLEWQRYDNVDLPEGS
ncbi:MAG: hypothetical protein KatS3mg076_1549 [Candidatus Binatia bacterium]|nr:MAG: hypothetical protein KatS3mg076_1549 [Candidatus Binatia bacterium]